METHKVKGERFFIKLLKNPQTTETQTTGKIFNMRRKPVLRSVFPDDPEGLSKLIKRANPAYNVVLKSKKLYASLPPEGTRTQ